MKYKVECQVLVTYEVEAESEEDAISEGNWKLMEDCLANNIDWAIYANKMEVKSND